MDFTMNYSPAQAHLPEAERNIQTLKEPIRVGFFRLPYKAIPLIMINFLVLELAYRLNLFPAKGGVLSYCRCLSGSNPFTECPCSYTNLIVSFANIGWLAWFATLLGRH